MLQCNIISHCLSPYPECSLHGCHVLLWLRECCCWLALHLCCLPMCLSSNCVDSMKSASKCGCINLTKIIPFLAIRSLHFLGLTATALPSCCMQNFVTITIRIQMRAKCYFHKIQIKIQFIMKWIVNSLKSSKIIFTFFLPNSQCD